MLVATLTTEGFTDAAAVSFFILILLVNGIWLLMRHERLSNGRQFFSWDEIRDFKQLEAQQTDSSKRTAYTAIRYAFNVCFTLMFIVPLLLLAIGYLRSHAH